MKAQPLIWICTLTKLLVQWLPFYPFSTDEEAIARHNDMPYGLHAVVYGGNKVRAQRVATRLEAGSVCINDGYMIWAAMDAPMGGVKESGMGRRHGAEGIRIYTEVQTIVINRTRLQVGDQKNALSIEKWMADVLSIALKLWRHIPFIR